MTAEGHDFALGGWVVHPLLGQIRRGDTVVRLEPKVMDILVCLARHGGDVVSRKELIEAVWPDTFVEEQAVTRAISLLRHALGGERDEFLQTIPKRGYRLAVPVRRLAAGAVPPDALPLDASPLDASLPDASPPVTSSPGAARRRRPLAAAAAVGCLAIVIAVTVWLGWFRSKAPARVMLAVLPLQNLTGEPDQDYVCDSLTEEMISRLGGLHPQRLGVIARTSSNAYRQTTKRVDQIGREMGVSYIVEGSVRQEGDRLRITAQLITTRDQAHVWTRTYEGVRGQLLPLYDLVAQSVTDEVRRRLVPDAPRKAEARSVTPGAWDAFVRGRYLLGRGTGPAFLGARNSFKSAVDRDASYAAAWAGLATSYIMLANYYVLPPGEARAEAKAAAYKALALDASVADARLALAAIKMEDEWDFRGAADEFHRAIANDPNSARAHQWYGALLGALGRFDEGIDELQQASQLDPASLRVGTDLGRAFYFARRYDEAIATYRKVLALEPNYSSAHTMLGLVFLEQRRYPEAIAELQQGVALLGTKDGYSTLLGYAYAVAGRRPDAEAMLAKQIDKWTKEHVGAAAVALTYAGLGDNDRALTWLETACESRDSAVVMLKAFPYWDGIRSSGRYNALLKRLGLPN